MDSWKATSELIDARLKYYKTRRVWRDIQAGREPTLATLGICPLCGSDEIKKFGMSWSHTQRFRCKACLRTFSEKPLPFLGIDLSNTRPSKRDKLKAVIIALLQGGTVRGVGRSHGLAVETVRKIYRQLKKAGILDHVRCACGQQASHQGWCSYRFNRSERRQAALARLHERQRRKLLL